MITVITHIYNEIIILPFFLEQYRKRFDDCKFIFYDHMSNDGSYEFLLNEKNVTIRRFDTNGTIDHSKYLDIKNNAWKDATTDWVCVADTDEIIDINSNQLKQEAFVANIIKFQGFNMVNLSDQYDIESLRKINHGCEFEPYSKSYLFNKKFIAEINYSPGSHTCNPQAIKYEKIKYSKNIYNAYHYKYINLDLLNKKNEEYSKRISDSAKKQGLSGHYLHTKEQTKKDWEFWKNKSRKLF